MMMFMGDNQFLGSFRVVLDELLKVCEDRHSSIEVVMKILLIFHISGIKGLKGLPINVPDHTLIEKVLVVMDHLWPGKNDDSTKTLIDSATKVDNVMKMGIAWCSWL